MTPPPRILFALLAAALLLPFRIHAAEPTLPGLTVVAYSGEQDPDEPTGADYIRFFTPEVGPFLSVVTPPSVTGSTALNVGGLFAEYPDAQLAALTQPSGETLLATFKPGIGGLTAADNVAMLWGDLNYAPDVQALAQTGTPEADLPEGVTIQKFMSLDGNGLPFFFATLQGSGVTSTNSLALCTFGEDQSAIAHGKTTGSDAVSFEFPLVVLVLVGDSVVVTGDNFKIVKVITALQGGKGTLAQGRWRTYNRDSDEPQIGVLLTFTDGSQAIYIIPADSTDSFSWTELLETGLVNNITGLNGYTITSFGLPAFDQVAYSVLANLKLGPVQTGSSNIITAVSPTPAVVPVVTASNDAALIYSFESETPRVLARKSDNVPFDANDNELSGVTIGGMSDPVVGQNGSVAFMVTLNGLPDHPNTGIEYYNSNTESLGLIANVGAEAPDVTGTGTIGKWAGFTSLVLPAVGGIDFEETKAGEFVPPDETGPVFLGTLAVSGTVTTANNLGLWAVNGFGELQLIFRSGQTVTVNDAIKTVRTFVALAPAPGSVGAASGYDGYGNVSVLATFTDGSTAIINISIPGVGAPV